MIRLLDLLLHLFSRILRSRCDLLLENLALRQQVGVLRRNCPRPRLTGPDKFFWVVLRRLWPGWKRALTLVQPETVVRWHREGFKLYWAWISRRRVRVGRTLVSKELRELIFRVVGDNPTWGAPRIHGELKMLGFDISERSVSRWLRRAPQNPEPSKRWMTFLNNHRDSIFNAEVTDTAKSFGIEPKRTSFRSPWQNGVAERWVGSCRRELLDHVIVVNERHLKRLMSEYVRYYHEDRTHITLAKGTPAGRDAATTFETHHRVVSTPRLGGLHHRYDLAA